jgi:hypothetical protein
MSNDPTITSARQDDARLHHLRARIAQRHVQFGRRGRLDLGRLMLRAAPVQVATLAEVAVEREHIATTPMRHPLLATIDHRLPPESDDAADVPETSPSSTATPGARARNRHQVRGPATLGDFVATDRADAFPYREWVATLANRTNVVVSDWCAAPSPLGIEKAVSIVQSRAYLENRARLLLLPFGKETASWRLATIDFASAARRHRCEFRMCFAVQDTSGVLSMTSPSVEIGFALPAPGATDPVFVLTVVTVVRFAAKRSAL